MSKIMYMDEEYSSTGMNPFEPVIELPNYQVSGSDDKALYDAIVALGWNDVLEG